MPPKKKIRTGNNNDLEVPLGELRQVYASQSLKHALKRTNSKYGSEITEPWAANYLKEQCKVTKNLPQETWLLIAPHVHRIENGGKQAEVLIHGTPLRSEKVQTAIKRYSRSADVSVQPATLPQLPPGVIVRPVVFPKLSFTLPELPFHSFEKRFYQISQRPYHIHEGPCESLVTINEDREIVEALQAVVPYESRHSTSFDSYRASDGIQVFPSSLYRSLICSISNNFAGLESIPKKKILDYLRSHTNENLLSMILSMRDLKTTRAIAANLFNAAIEADDDTTLDLVLTSSFSGVTANKNVYIGGVIYTPLERAAQLGSGRVMKKLLVHGALVLPEGPDLYSLMCESLRQQYLHPPYERETRKQFEPYLDEELLHMLHNAGARPKASSIRWFIKEASRWSECAQSYRGIVISMSERWDLETWTKLNRSGTTLLLFKAFDSPILLRFLDLIIHHNVDADHVVCGIDDPLEPATIIDTAALRGDLDLVTRMGRFGIKATKDTLLFAILSGKKAVQLEIMKHYEATEEPFRWEIPLRDADRLMARLGGSWIIDEDTNPYLKTNIALIRASTVGDVNSLEMLLEAPHNFTPQQLGFALTLAVRHQRRDIALILLANKADANVGISLNNNLEAQTPEPPIYFALRQGDRSLVRALLDAGANLNYVNSGEKTDFIDPPIVLAAKSEDPELVKMVIEAGADVNPPIREYDCSALAHAAFNNDRATFRLLLDAGCRYDTLDVDQTVLVNAVESEDVDMVKYVLDFGADPHDSRALDQAYMTNDAMLDLILEKHYMLYGEARSWGADVLWNTIFDTNYAKFEKLLRYGCSPSGFPEMSSAWRVDAVGEVVANMSPFGIAISMCKNVGMEFVKHLLRNKEIWKCYPESIVSDSTKIGTCSGSPTVVERKTAFMIAIESNHKPIIELMLQEDADVNFPAKLGVKRTPVQQAAEVGTIEIVELLFNKGADIHAPPAERGGGTALQLAALKGNAQVVRFLLEREADVNAAASLVNGRTALEGAAEHGRLEVIEILLSAIAAASPSNNGQFSRARALAAKNGSTHIIDMIDEFVSRNPHYSSDADVDQARSGFEATDLRLRLIHQSDIGKRHAGQDSAISSATPQQPSHSDFDHLFDFDALCCEGD